MSEEVYASAAPMVDEEEWTDDIVRGMQYASLAITDDEPGTLKKIGRANPWHVEALKLITGSDEEAHKPLTDILERHMDMECDVQIDHSGVTPAGHVLDTQGYIAHNDEAVVLAFRCSTSFYDWLTNLNTTSSEWEVEEDASQGFSGYCSGFDGLCGPNLDHKPRVHTGFYNNFLSTIPDLKQHLEPFIGEDQKPRKVFVVGHSLGAGIATLAGIYLLFGYDWDTVPQRLRVVTAGSPRACLASMRDAVDESLAKTTSASFSRVVRNQDVVTTVPPSLLGFKHVGQVVYITKDNVMEMQVDEHTLEGNPEEEPSPDRIDTSQLERVLGENDDEQKEEEDNMTSYERKINRVPVPFRDHMPDFYLKPMMGVRKGFFPEQEPEMVEMPTDEPVVEEESVQEEAPPVVEPVAEEKPEPPPKAKEVPKKKKKSGGCCRSIDAVE